MDIVDVMDGEIERLARSALPELWRRDRRLDGLASVGEVIWVIRECDARSDRVLRALVERGPDDGTAAVVVLAALSKLRLGRCRGAQDRMAALLSELAVVLGEAWLGEFDVARSSLAGAMVDRAWGKARRSECFDTAPKGVGFEHHRLEHGVEDHGHRVVECERAVAETRARLARVAAREGDRGSAVVRAWNVYARLLDQEERSTSERNQVAHARKVLRRSLTPDLELVGRGV